jgi:hypothetical protein
MSAASVFRSSATTVSIWRKEHWHHQQSENGIDCACNFRPRKNPDKIAATAFSSPEFSTSRLYGCARRLVDGEIFRSTRAIPDPETRLSLCKKLLTLHSYTPNILG